ncbi:MAG: AMP-binding protein [Clostridia bacterium]|nr:AMP-binding protein [Clostridia bacterium]
MILDDILEILKEKSNNKAYTVNNESYSYKQLYKFVCNIYDFLLKENKEKRPVVVYGHKEVYMKATFIACSLAGMTYVPIDDSMPSDRIEQIIKQVNPLLIIGKNVTKEKIYEIMNKENYNEINKIYLKPNDIYYIIFTSGSTGIPKGVKVI